MQSLGNREPTLFGLGQLKEFLDVTPIVLQMCRASHRCSVNRAQKMLHWCTFAPVLPARRCSVNVALDLPDQKQGTVLTEETQKSIGAFTVMMNLADSCQAKRIM